MSDKQIKVESIRLRVGETVLELSVDEAKALKRELDSFLDTSEPEFGGSWHPMIPDLRISTPIRTYTDCFEMDLIGADILGPMQMMCFD